MSLDRNQILGLAKMLGAYLLYSSYFRCSELLGTVAINLAQFIMISCLTGSFTNANPSSSNFLNTQFFPTVQYNILLSIFKDFINAQMHSTTTGVLSILLTQVLRMSSLQRKCYLLSSSVWWLKYWVFSKNLCLKMLLVLYIWYFFNGLKSRQQGLLGSQLTILPIHASSSDNCTRGLKSNALLGRWVQTLSTSPCNLTLGTICVALTIANGRSDKQ